MWHAARGAAPPTFWSYAHESQNQHIGMAERMDTSPEECMDTPSEERMDTSPDTQDSPLQTVETARIYSKYDQNAVPPHPGPDWTRFVCISDTHSSKRYFVPPGDVLLHAGDLSSVGTSPKLTLTIDWLMTMPHPAKV